MNNIKIVFFYTLSFIYVSQGQNDSIHTPIKGLEFEIAGGHLYHSPNNHASTILPPIFSKDINLQNVGDSPLWHGIGWIEFNTQYKNYGFNICADLIGEHRGMSYGVFDKNNIIVFPRILLGFDSSFVLFGQKFNAGVSVGHFSDKRIMEGLQIYNMDWIGNEFYLKWNHLKLSHNTIGDLMYWIGLNIGDASIWTLTIEDVNLFDDYKIDVKYCYFGEDKQFLYQDNYDNFIKSYSNNLSFAITKNDVKIYSEIGFRNEIPNQEDKLKYRTGFLAGVDYKFKNENIGLKLNAEYRFYGYQFNLGFRDTTIDKYSTSYVGETISRNFYPIYLYDRQPLSQWALFTDYQHKNVSGISLIADIDWYFYDKFILFGEFDINIINASNEEAFIYPLYRTGIGFQPLDGTNIKLSLTNKEMNLNKHYPTMYLISAPMVMLSLNYNFKIL
ncbi:MAG: hypothetical protein RO257_06155 [Candidatus Kapabacteria bacterium]|nr:hypothetical protein [Candidatus Kapabacteria bacterium]